MGWIPAFAGMILNKGEIVNLRGALTYRTYILWPVGKLTNPQQGHHKLKKVRELENIFG